MREQEQHDGRDPRYTEASPRGADEQPSPAPERPVPDTESRRGSPVDKPSQAEGERDD
jgi:hypothetical protein